VFSWPGGRQRFGPGAGYGYAVVQAGEMEKPQDMVAAADRVQAGAVRRGLPGRAAQGAR
jgi:hypothetical protein